MARVVAISLFAEEAEEQVFGADVVMQQARRFLRSSRPTRYQYSLGLLSWQFRGKSRRTLLAMRGEAFLHVGAAETEEFQAK